MPRRDREGDGAACGGAGAARERRADSRLARRVGRVRRVSAEARSQKIVEFVDSERLSSYAKNEFTNDNILSFNC